MKSLWRRERQLADAEARLAVKKLSLPAALEDGRVPMMFERFSYFASVLILALLVWGSVAEIREFTRAGGQVVPSGFLKTVHHLEGGQVQTIEVREGAVVEKGQALLTLSPVAAVSDLGQLKVRRHHLSLKMQRLEALIQNKPLSFEKEMADDSLMATERELFETERNRLAKELQALEARLSQRRVEAQSVAQELESLARQVHIYSEKLDIKSRLVKDGYVSRRSYLEAQSDLEKVRSQEITAKGRFEAAKEQFAAAEAELHQARTAAEAKYSTEYSELAGEVAELDQTLIKQQDKVDRLTVVSPVRGIIQDLVQHAPGEVVKPGDVVARIVPVDEEVVAEVNVEPKDIGHVKIGDEAEITISTYDPNVYGVLKGKVEHLSATSIRADASSPPFFKAIIKLEKGYVGSESAPVSILPGMEVEANIVTGAKSLVRYFLKPVYRSLGRAFSER